jgi:hypothetical protein
MDMQQTSNTWTRYKLCRTTTNMNHEECTVFASIPHGGRLNFYHPKYLPSQNKQKEFIASFTPGP